MAPRPFRAGYGGFALEVGAEECDGLLICGVRIVAHVAF